MSTHAVSSGSLVPVEHRVKFEHGIPDVRHSDELERAIKNEQLFKTCAKIAARTVIGLPIAFVFWCISSILAGKINKLIHKEFSENIEDINKRIQRGDLKLTVLDKKWDHPSIAFPAFECQTAESAFGLLKRTDVDLLHCLTALKITGQLPVGNEPGKLAYNKVEILTDKDQILMRIDGTFRIYTPARKEIAKECTQANGKKVIQKVVIKVMEEGTTQASALFDVRTRQITSIR